ncbi:MAG: SufD family Fe-S cluster assembly protein, partial [Deltaproteobacteria bacterium]|nr:SufD family Fe-S cluster assembly protein [Deltaproteobacteria bacterium]
MTQPWLQERRERAARLNTKLPVPTGGEDWRRTNFGRVDLGQFEPLPPVKNGADQGAASRLLPAKIVLAGELLYGEQASPPTLDPALLKQGVWLTSLTKACEEKKELVGKYLGRGLHGRQEKFLAQNEANWQTGVFLYIPKNTAVELPFLLTSALAREDSSCFPRLLVVLDQGAKATLLHYSASTNQNKNNFVNGVYEVYLEEGAELTWIDLQNWSRQTYEVAHKRVEVGRNARLKWVIHCQGGKLAKANIETVLNGEGAKGEVIGLV